MLKQIFIPVAAFAVTATSASAFVGSEVIERHTLNLTSEQASAIETAREIQIDARAEAQKVLEAVGLTEEKMHEIHEIARQERAKEVEAVRAAVENNDYDAFVAAVDGTPLAEKITSKEYFEKFVKARTLKKAGELEAAQELFTELGLPERLDARIGERGNRPDFGDHGLE